MSQHQIGSVPGLEEAIQKRNEAQQPTWEKNLKRGVSVAVLACVGVQAFTHPHTIAFQFCAAVIGIGAALGITSTGNAK